MLYSAACHQDTAQGHVYGDFFNAHSVTDVFCFFQNRDVHSRWRLRDDTLDSERNSRKTELG